MSYIILAEKAALANQERLRAGAERMARVRLAKKLAVPEAQALDPVNPAIIVRDADYVVDFVPAATAVGLTGWLSMPMVAIAGMYSVFANNVPAALTPQVPNNQAVVFYGIDVLLADMAGETVTFIQFGVGAANNRRAQFDLEGLYGGQAATGYFSQPVYYDPQEIMNVQIRARVATGVGARVRLATFIAEPIQQTVI
ncbi:MAG: hypothetical protein WC359_13665 [Dehalococcoidia bacterium]|jgi:hypothetical protein